MAEAGSLQVLVLAPTGQDAALLAKALGREGIESRVFRSARELTLAARQSAGALLIAEEALAAGTVLLINEMLAEQPPWSDLPLVVMTSSGESTLASLRILKSFAPAGNVSLLERPFRSLTLVSVMQVALRARRRQYQVRELLEAHQKATNIRDEFISIASHELKTPLTALKLQSQITRRQTRDGAIPMSADRVQKFVTLTGNQVDRLTRLVEDMLDVSRINSQKLLLDKTGFDLTALAAEIVDRFAPQLEAAGCEATLKNSGPVNGEWDRYRIEQILCNLITNVIRYAPGAPVTVETYAEGDQALLRVTDHGPGIAPENQEKIFHRFERAVASNNISGLGLGLYICRQIAESHGGAISVESSLGEGSPFILRLPASASAAAPLGATHAGG